jgi:23S rRNA pseudouridine1911/1915/1917 synthase
MNESESIRLDIAVVHKLSVISRAFAAKLIDAGHVKVNSELVTKPSTLVGPLDQVEVNYDPAKVKIPKIDLPAIYEDQDVIVIDKPAGILSHSKGGFNPEATVASWLQSKYSGTINERSGIVHRLDRLTSGVMICAKNDQASSWLKKQFSERKVKKTYVAIVSGQLEHPQAVLDLPIARNPKNPQSFKVNSSGKSAITQYRVLETNESVSLLELKPTTGRTHQLRVHLAHINHPIVGDTLYGKTTADRLYLHATELELTLPSKERQIFTSTLPKEFKLYMKS